MAQTGCRFDGCDKPARRAGYCNGHYAQITRGKPLKPLEKRSKRNSVCSFEGCGHPENRWGLCAAHVAQKRRGTELRPVRRKASIPDVCTVDGCEFPHRSLGYCSAHYAQHLRGEGIRDFIPQGLSLADRLDLYTNKKGPDDCWEWTGTITQGYGVLNMGGRGGTTVRAHRAAWVRAYGPIPEGKWLDHLCGNRKCLNVAHLRLATPAENAFNRTVPSRNNTSGYRGVFRTRGGRWYARVTVRGKTHHLGVFDSPQEADAVAAKFRDEHMGLWESPNQREIWPTQNPAAVTDAHILHALGTIKEDQP